MTIRTTGLPGYYTASQIARSAESLVLSMLNALTKFATVGFPDDPDLPVLAPNVAHPHSSMPIR
jgi:hypothetical protein